MFVYTVKLILYTGRERYEETDLNKFFVIEISFWRMISIVQGFL